MTVGIIRIEGPYTEAERDALTGMPTYMMIFNSDNLRLEVWDGGTWEGVLGHEVRIDGGLIVTDSLIVGGVIDVDGGIAADSAVDSPLAVQDRLKPSQATNSVTAAGDLTLTEGNTFVIAGTTTINAIDTTDWSDGSQITLLFVSTPTVKHNTAGGGTTAVILLAGSADFVASAGDTLTLILCEISPVRAWREIGRAVI